MDNTSVKTLVFGSGGGGDTAFAQIVSEAFNLSYGTNSHSAMGAGNSGQCYMKYLSCDYIHSTEQGLRYFNTPENEEEKQNQIAAIHKNVYYKKSCRQGFSIPDTLEYLKASLCVKDEHELYRKCVFKLSPDTIEKFPEFNFKTALNNGTYNTLYDDNAMTSVISSVDTYLAYTVGGCGDKYITMDGGISKKENIYDEIATSIIGMFEHIIEGEYKELRIMDVGGDAFNKIMDTPIDYWGRDEIAIISALIISQYYTDLNVIVTICGLGCDAHKHPVHVLETLIDVGFKKDSDFADTIKPHLKHYVDKWESGEYPILGGLFENHRATRIYYNTTEIRDERRHELVDDIRKGLCARSEKGCAKFPPYKPETNDMIDSSCIMLMGYCMSLNLGLDVFVKSETFMHEFEILKSIFETYFDTTYTHPEPGQ